MGTDRKKLTRPKGAKPTQPRPRKKPAKVDKVLELIAHYRGYGYSATKPEYPETLTLPGFVDKREQHEHRKADCTVFVGGVVMALTMATFHWSMADYRGLMIAEDPVDPWSAVKAWARALGRHTYDGGGSTTPGAWYAVQGWSGLQDGQFTRGSRGHQWLERNGKTWQLASNEATLIEAGPIPTRYKEIRRVRVA